MEVERIRREERGERGRTLPISTNPKSCCLARVRSGTANLNMIWWWWQDWAGMQGHWQPLARTASGQQQGLHSGSRTVAGRCRRGHHSQWHLAQLQQTRQFLVPGGERWGDEWLCVNHCVRKVEVG
jgi:hypothetical protein